MQTIKISKVCYNNAIGAFEARVDIERENGTFRYPCQLVAPKDIGDDQLKLGLARHALRMSDTVVTHDFPRIIM